MAQILSFEEMDAAAKEAEQELQKIDPKIVDTLGEWWFKWYLKAGHKRLGRILVKKYKERQSGQNRLSIEP